MQSKNIFIPYQLLTYQNCSEEEKKLISEAHNAAKQAYAPYSHFKVGTALLLSNGKIVTGNNQENAAYPSGLCAERVALFYAKAQWPYVEIKAMAIICIKNNEIIKNPVPPCGSCRQVLIETQQRQNTPITTYLAGNEEIIKVDSADYFLPFTFNQSFLD